MRAGSGPRRARIAAEGRPGWNWRPSPQTSRLIRGDPRRRSPRWGARRGDDRPEMQDLGTTADRSRQRTRPGGESSGSPSASIRARRRPGLGARPAPRRTVVRRTRGIRLARAAGAPSANPVGRPHTPCPTPPVFSFTEIMLDSSPYSIHYHSADRPPVRARRNQGESPPPRKPPRSPTALPFARRPLKTLKTQESEFPEISFPCRARGSWNRARRPSGARSRSALRSSAAGSTVVAAITAAPL
jgi:hypothetical protein